MALVEIENVTKLYPHESRPAVDCVSLTIDAGETLGIVGESGSGKTTLARIVLGLVQPTSGSIRVAGIDIAHASASEMRATRRQMQPVFQDPYGALNPRMKIAEIIAEPLIIHSDSIGHFSRTAIRERVSELLTQVGLDSSALNRFPHEFSGGQRQRINIARALALRPRLVILDEPVSALDVSVGAQIINLLRALQQQHGLTYLFISHSMPLVRYLCTRVAVMRHGRVVELGETLALCDHPQQEYTRQLIAATPELPFCAA
jgi:peptide/nickel transport system ATP-binding protein